MCPRGTAITTFTSLNADPRPCPACGSAVAWRLPDGSIACDCGGGPVPAGSTLIVLARLPRGGVWELHPWNTPVVEDPGPKDLVDPDELTPCPKCGKLELWQNVVGGWRCEHCDRVPNVATFH